MPAIRAASLRSALASFRSDVRGSVTHLFALVSIPMIAASGVALDFNRVVDAQVTLQDLADRAAITAAAFTGTEAEQIAEAYNFIAINAIVLPGVTYTPNVSITGDDVLVVLETGVKGMLLPVAFAATSNEVDSVKSGGDTDLTVAATARYKQTDPGLVCLLTTNQTAADAVFLSGTRTFTANGCGIHSDSSDAGSAIHLQGNRDAFGDFFHSVGGWSQAGGAGSFSTEPEGGFDVFGDPFNLSIACPNAASGTVTPANGSTLAAVKYNNITIQNNRTVTFSAGVHYIFGTIDIKNGGLLIGNNVTLVMCGASAHLDMNGGSLQLAAPTTGTYPGFAVVGEQSATSANDLEGGPSTFIRGIWYTPKMRLEISGNSDFNVDSAYFPVIADTFYLNGSGSMTISMDFNAYGYSNPTELMSTARRTVWLVD